MNHPLESSVKTMIKEAFVGPPIPVKDSWFTKVEPNSGIFGVLQGLSAEEASQSVHGTTIAAHADHVRYYMWGANELLRTGMYPKMKWEESWEIRSVDELEWHRIPSTRRTCQTKHPLRSLIQPIISERDS